MIRVLLVDDSPSVRQVLSRRLIERGYEVIQAPDGVTAAEVALAQPPDFVVSDLWMPGISGVQLCRLLRAEPRTSHVPVVLITGESQRRSRFWARTAGAAAYVTKDDPTALFETLERLVAEFPPRPPDSIRPASRVPMQHRLFQRLDAALFESVVAGEVRALAHKEGEADSVFSGLASLASEVAAYRWLALHVASTPMLFLHVHPDCRDVAEREARRALALPSPREAELSVVSDDRAVPGRATPPVVEEVRAGGQVMGSIALGPNERGASREDRELVSIIATELGGPLRVVSLVEQMRRLAMSDPLTGLLNRRAFVEAMGRAVAAFERHGAPTSILLLDVDHFKQVNDGHGHDGGDAVLTGIADLLSRGARRNDVVARWGGEELVVGLSHTGIAGAEIAAERIRRAIMDRSFLLPDGAEIKVTASIGIASVVKSERLEACIARADRAMYAAKSGGRNRCEADGRENSTSV
jgi:two-component system cell cycle response regulator